MVDSSTEVSQNLENISYREHRSTLHMQVLSAESRFFSARILEALKNKDFRKRSLISESMEVYGYSTASNVRI